MNKYYEPKPETLTFEHKTLMSVNEDAAEILSMLPATALEITKTLDAPRGSVIYMLERLEIAHLVYREHREHDVQIVWHATPKAEYCVRRNQHQLVLGW